MKHTILTIVLATGTALGQPAVNPKPPTQATPAQKESSPSTFPMPIGAPLREGTTVAQPTPRPRIEHRTKQVRRRIAREHTRRSNRNHGHRTK